MPPVERDDDEWCAVDGNGEETNVAVVDEATEAAAEVEEEAAETKEEPSSHDSKTSPLVGSMGDLQLEAPLAASAIKFFEGDRAMYIPETEDSEKEEHPIKVRILGVDRDQYRVSSTETEEMTIPIDHPALYSMEEYESSRLHKEEATMGVVSTDAYGLSSGGGAFSTHDTTNPITELRVHSGAIADGVGVYYSNGTSSFHGGKGGGQHRMVLKGGEYVTEVVVKYGKFVEALTFQTNIGRTFGPWGGSGGFSLLKGTTSSIVTLKAPNHFYALAGIHGRCGKFIDSLGMHWAPIVSKMGPVPKKQLALQLAKQQLLQSSDLYGNGLDGNAFDDGHYNIHVTHLTVTSNDKRGVMGISVRYFTGKEVSHGVKRKSKNDDEASLGMNRQEWVTEVRVRSKGGVLSLTFVTSMGRALGPCGTSIPDEKESLVSSEEERVSAPPGYMLIGFKGRASDTGLSAIGFNWSPAPQSL